MQFGDQRWARLGLDWASMGLDFLQGPTVQSKAQIYMTFFDGKRYERLQTDICFEYAEATPP